MKERKTEGERKERGKVTLGRSEKVSHRAAAVKAAYLWIAEPEVQTSKVSEKAEASEENPVLEGKDKT